MKNILKYLMVILILGTVVVGVGNIDFKVEAQSGKYINVIKGTGKDFGDEVAIGDEHFYVIKYDGNKLKLLAKYGVDTESTWLQSESVNKGFHAGVINGIPYVTENRHGEEATDYEGSNLEYSVNKYVKTLNSKYNINVEGSIVGLEDVIFSVQNFVPDILEIYSKIKPDIKNLISLIDRGNFEIKDFKPFVNVVVNNLYELIDKYNYLVDISYWTTFPVGSEVMITIPNLGNRLEALKKILGVKDVDELFELIEQIANADNDEMDEIMNTRIAPLVTLVLKQIEDKGILRPIITVSLDEINFKEPKICEGEVCFTDYDADKKVSQSDEVCIGEECFYVISTDNHNVRMLAKYNLETGYECPQNIEYQTGVAPRCNKISNASGRQHNKALGANLINTLINIPSETYGVTEYANSKTMGSNPNSYKGSLAKEYVDNYIDYLKTISKQEFTGTLLNMDDIQALAKKKLYDVSEFTELVPNPKSLKSMNNLGLKFNKKTLQSMAVGNGPEDIILLYDMDVPSWLYSSTYWTKTGVEEEGVVAITSAGITMTGEYDSNEAAGIRPVVTMELSAIPVRAESACYECDGELVWTDNPAASCKKNDSITTKGMCINNPKTGLRKVVIVLAIVLLSMVLGYTLYRRYNRFERV